MLSRRSEHPTFIVCSGTCPSQRRQAPGGVVRAGFLEEVGVSGQGWESGSKQKSSTDVADRATSDCRPALILTAVLFKGLDWTVRFKTFSLFFMSSASGLIRGEHGEACVGTRLKDSWLLGSMQIT